MDLNGAAQTGREGGVGDLNYPLVSDLKREISVKYGVLSEEGVALRGLFHHRQGGAASRCRAVLSYCAPWYILCLVAAHAQSQHTSAVRTDRGGACQRRFTASKVSIPRSVCVQTLCQPPQGVIQHATINNLAFGRNIEETLRILQAPAVRAGEPRRGALLGGAPIYYPNDCRVSAGH